MQELILVRHGESLHHVAGLAGGWTDVGLTPRGRKQALATADRVRKLLRGRPTQFYSSDLKRAQETAAALSTAIQSRFERTSELRELGNGLAAGRTEAEAKALARKKTAPVLDWVPYEGGESWRDMQTRVWAFLSRIEALDVPVAVIVTHGNPIVCAIHWWLGMQSDELIASTMFRADPASITSLTMDGDGCRTVAFSNNTAHLEPSQLG